MHGGEPKGCHDRIHLYAGFLINLGVFFDVLPAWTMTMHEVCKHFKLASKNAPTVTGWFCGLCPVSCCGKKEEEKTA